MTNWNIPKITDYKVVIFTQPEGHKTVFNIPLNAPINGDFYIHGNSHFMDANPHVDFNYMKHDLDHRGVRVSDAFYTNKGYMAGLISHSDYFAQFLDHHAISYVQNTIGLETILNSTDAHFNDIPLRSWDQLSMTQFIKSDKWKVAACSTYQADTRQENRFIWSQSDNVCTAKTCAGILRKKDGKKRRYSVRFVFVDNSEIMTEINGTPESIKEYYAENRVFNIGQNENDNMQKVSRLIFLDRGV